MMYYNCSVSLVNILQIIRINMISRLLQNTTTQDAADIISHKDIKSTIAYKRYALNKKEIQKLLNKIDN